MAAFKPRPYQDYAIRQILARENLGLMLDMGLGKTVITLTALKELKADYKILIIAPLRVAESTWADEIEKWEHLKGFNLVKILGSAAKREKALNTPADAYIINRENVVWLRERLGKAWDFNMLVIDESSSFKNSQSKRFKALKSIKPRVKRTVILTGTPAPNGLLDLWSQIYLLDRGVRLGQSLTSYRNTFFLPDARNGEIVYSWKLREGAGEIIRSRVKDLCISMSSQDYLTLPPIIYNAVEVKLSEKELKQYRQLEREMVAEIDGEELAVTSAAALSTKLLQLASGVAYDQDGGLVELHKRKLDALNDLADTGNTLIFYWYKHEAERIKANFPQARELKTAADIKEWNAGRLPMLLVHPASAGHGLNLQYGGSIAIWYSLTWSLELYQQANKRLHRPGQEKPVIIHHLVAKYTLDPVVLKALESKETGQRQLLDAVKRIVKSNR